MERSAGRAMQHRLGDFLFDGEALLKEPPAPAKYSSKESAKAMLNPIRMFPNRSDILAGALFATQSKDGRDDLPDLSIMQAVQNMPKLDRWQMGITTKGLEAKKNTLVYRETAAAATIAAAAATGTNLSLVASSNSSSMSSLLHKQDIKSSSGGGKNFVLVEESRLEELSRFESTLQRERQIIAHNANELVEAKEVLEHNMLDPRVPTLEIKHALQQLSSSRLDFLYAEWRKLLTTWSTHAAHYNYNKPHLFRDFNDDDDGKEERTKDTTWLLKACPVPQRAKKLRLARQAAQAFFKRQDRDTMLFEDDRSFLHQQIFEATNRSKDYDRYCFLCNLFGPMSEAEWAKAGSRPGLRYWIKATSAALKIQHRWDLWYGTHKLKLYRAARLIQTCWRAHFGWKMLRPLIVIRKKFSKRTYWYFCWDRWIKYNYIVRTIREKIEYHRLLWSRKTWASWKKWTEMKTAKKKEILKNFAIRFGGASTGNLYNRWVVYTKKSKRIKRWFMHILCCPQFGMWIKYVQITKKRRIMHRAIIPFQAQVRCYLRQKWYLKRLRLRPLMLRFTLNALAHFTTNRKRIKATEALFATWCPAEVSRRRKEKEELERRRQLREKQLAEEKADLAVVELKKHLKSVQGKTQLKEATKALQRELALEGGSRLSYRTAYAQAEQNLVQKCFECIVEREKHEYRTNKAPYLVCADPTCKQIFSTNDAYKEHIESFVHPGRGAILIDAAADGGDIEGGPPLDLQAEAAALEKEAAIRAASANAMKKQKALASKTKKRVREGLFSSAPIADSGPQETLRSHSTMQFADFHKMIRHSKGIENVRNYLGKKFGICGLIHNLDAWEAIQMWRFASLHANSDIYINKGLLIYETFLRPSGATRPVEIILADGDLLSESASTSMDDKGVFASAISAEPINDEDQGSSGCDNWYTKMLSRCESVKSREYVGFFQTFTAQRSSIRIFLGMNGKVYKAWTDERTLPPDIFDRVEWACFMSIYRALYLDKADADEFSASKEYAAYKSVSDAEINRYTRELYEACKEFRKDSFLKWTKDFNILEASIGELALVIADQVADRETDRLVDKVALIWREETLFRIQYEEQKEHEFKLAIADDAVDWVSYNLEEHVFEHYVRAMLNTMLTHPECIEGMMEYAGMLKGVKKLKKHLEVVVQAPGGRRESANWQLEQLREAIREDLAHMPLDYMSAVRRVQTRARGMIGRNRMRKMFVEVFIKKYDATSGRCYYINSLAKPPSVSWERPMFMRHLFPNSKW